MSALLRSYDDDQDEGHREWNHGLWLGLSALWGGDRLYDRYSSAVASGTARYMGAFGRLVLLSLVVAPSESTALEAAKWTVPEHELVDDGSTRARADRW